MRVFFLVLVATLATRIDLFAAEAGMPQLDPKYWASQAFWLVLVFTLLYISISKFFIPKIKDTMEDRNNKIKDDIEKAKKEVQKILNENKNKLNAEIQNKKRIIDKEIEEEILKAQNEIKNLKKEAVGSIGKISEEIAMKIIEEISGDKLNENSIKAAVAESSKKNINKYL